MSGSVQFRKRPAGQVEERLTQTVDLDDYHKIRKREANEDWVLLCEELAENDWKYAEEQFALKRVATARYFFSAALGAFMVAGYGLTDLTEEKLKLYRRQVDCAKKFAELGPNSFVPVKIPYKDYHMDGWLVTPRTMKPDHPIVIMIPGATAFKDSFIRGMDGWLMSGVSVLLMDGPGQGTTRYFNNGYLEVEVEKAYSKMVDFIKNDGRFGKIIIYGGSTGGYYVVRAAATDKRIDMCLINGGSYYPTEILDYSMEYRHKFAVLYNVSDDEMDAIFPRMNLKGFAENLECPLLVLHGGADPIFKVESAKKIYDVAKSKDKTFVAFPGAWHCCAGEGSKAVRLTMDWLAEHTR
ncbi:MAG: alpha/beta hydrolase [Spirochaetales bacterium]|jgi:dienelactone hydrolase|nr:alpha/beta hydrolase [Spirochaetales bacterium]